MPKSTLYQLNSLKADWQQQLSQAITNPLELLNLLDLDATDFPLIQQASESFQLKLPRAYVDKIEPGNPDDPLLKQVMATAAELDTDENYCADPVGDLQSMPVPGLLHKYHGRVLLITTGACAIHCRYCFRRHFPYSDNHSAKNQWQESITYIDQNTDVSEVILSGGDPLILSDSKLQQLIDQLNSIDHVTTLRIHSRIPVTLPSRITDQLITTLTSSNLQICMVIHANHSNEIGDEEQTALRHLNQAGITLLNQSVLLRGVNDCSVILSNLSHRLFESKVLPYYLHMLDPVQGASHFRVNEKQAVKLLKDLRNKLPGYLVPCLVKETAGEKSKLPLFEL
ncbi:MAG: EF-P beta-lysylation protein EpmB [Gammaproteobacteria bacterium]|nr:EF-P beta-lysylation protein EpmB [Gammaproteobacteria bacterium]MCW8911039.1 EF-P beta-lysylation protein EpmB [Gammaproteobacteria bacterium]MCW9004531.1 EF-P beta-lysylation protein EpmB [Gammaproteobacteria bacterium]